MLCIVGLNLIYPKENSNLKMLTVITHFPYQLPCGVPQGSILVPLIFLLYVNGLSNTSSLLINISYLFTDDAILYFSSKNPSHQKQPYNHELKSVAEWMKCNQLVLKYH